MAQTALSELVTLVSLNMPLRRTNSGSPDERLGGLVPYRVLDNEELNWADRSTDKNSYAKMLEAACNAMERDGYSLVSVVHGDMESMNPHTFIFHRPEDD